jgi:hypothetical protein
MQHLARFWRSALGDRSGMESCGVGPLQLHDRPGAGAVVHGHCMRDRRQHDHAILYVWSRTNFTYHGSGRQMKGLWYDPLTGLNVSIVTDGKSLLPPAEFVEDVVLHLSPAAAA